MSDSWDESGWSAMFSKYERPKGRMALPCCPACGHEPVLVDVRTSNTLHLRCPQCGHQMSVAKPSVTVML